MLLFSWLLLGCGGPDSLLMDTRVVGIQHDRLIAEIETEPGATVRIKSDRKVDDETGIATFERPYDSLEASFTVDGRIDGLFSDTEGYEFVSHGVPIDECERPCPKYFYDGDKVR
ncbi:MAG: hypothetical protein AAFV53_03235 [Myxococcota bacterium]